MAVVYQHRRLDTNDVFYIGIGKNIKRAYNTNKRNCFWKSIVAKTDFIVEILYDNIEWSEAVCWEEHYINNFGRRNKNPKGTLCNLTDGGEGVPGYFTEDIKKEWSEKYSGSNNPMFGKYGSDHPAYGSPGYWLGKKQPQKLIEKRIASSIGQLRPKQSAALKGRFTGDKNPMFGKKLPNHSKRMKGINNPDWKGYIEVFDKKSGDFIGKYISTVDAGKELNVHPQTISSIVLNKPGRKSANGYTFRRVNEKVSSADISIK